MTPSCVALVRQHFISRIVPDQDAKLFAAGSSTAWPPPMKMTPVI